MAAMTYMWMFALWLSGAPLMQAAAPTRTIADAAWLAGCWIQQSDTRQYDEQWMAPAGGTMLGMSRTVTRGKTSGWEYLQLREEGADIFYVATPSNQAQTRFKLTDARDGFLRFENPEHDFPQVITYTRRDDGSLLAQISGPMNGQTRTIDFPMRRGGC